MKLYYADVLAPRKVCALARYLQLPVTFVFLDLKNGEHKTSDYLALNPNGKVPTLVDGEIVTWEADAILCHLARKASSDLWPRSSAHQIDIIRWFSWATNHFTRAGAALYFEFVIKSRFGIGPVDSIAVGEAQAAFRDCAPVLDAHLKGRKWLVGDRLTVADFSVAGALAYATESEIPLNEFAQIRRWYDELNLLEAWRNPFPATSTSVS